jgi:hypothetical protein
MCVCAYIYIYIYIYIYVCMNVYTHDRCMHLAQERACVYFDAVRLESDCEGAYVLTYVHMHTYTMCIGIWHKKGVTYVLMP